MFNYTAPNEKQKFSPSRELQNRSLIKSFEDYQSLYRQSIEQPEQFWAKMAEPFVWHQRWNRVLAYDWKNDIRIRWFEGAKTNICENAVDRHLKENADRTAFIWIGNKPGENRKISYGQLQLQICQFANALKKLGVKRGDRIAIYMPMIPELPVALLACARIGGIHSVIFGGFSAESIKNRIMDCGAEVLITADSCSRGNKVIPLKEICDEAMDLCEKENHSVRACIVYKRSGEKVSMKSSRDIYWNDACEGVSSECPIESMEAEDPLFILYTSGSTGKPKGVLHTTAGYMVYATQTFRYVFDYHPEDIYWCTADVGWITGHTYVVYGPLCAGATSVIFEGIPNYPNPDRCWQIIDEHKVTTFYTAPTAIRSLMKEGDKWPAKYKLDSLKILGSVGEPINPEAWRWYYDQIGHKNCDHRRYLVANRNRWHYDFTYTGCHHDKTWLRHPPFFWY